MLSTQDKYCARCGAVNATNVEADGLATRGGYRAGWKRTTMDTTALQYHFKADPEYAEIAGHIGDILGDIGL